MELEMELTGVQATVDAMDDLRDSHKRAILRPSISAGARVIMRAAKENTKKSQFADSSGALNRSIGQKVKISKVGAWAVIGTRVGIGDRKHGGRKQVRKPSRYGHLVEKGHGGPHAAAPHPWLEPAFRDSKGESLAAIFARLRIEHEKKVKQIAARAAAKAKRK